MISEIDGKISSGGSNLNDLMEDKLTGDVFGTLRYLPFHQGLGPILNKARLYTNKDITLNINFHNSLNFPKYDFWPKYSGSDGTLEPDLIISHEDHLIMVEIKFKSPKSGVENPHEKDQAKIRDQLAKEFKCLHEHFKKYEKKSLIYLTADKIIPTQDLEDGFEALKKVNLEDKYQNNTYWLSWFDVQEKIEDLQKQPDFDTYQKLILEDINSLLLKKNFRGFRGFDKLPKDEIKRFQLPVIYTRD